MFSGYSGTSFFDSFMLATYNAIFTGLPIMFYSLDKDVSEDNLMNNPSLYQETQRGAFMNWKWLLYWFVRSFLQVRLRPTSIPTLSSGLA
jgi:phospholipid-translocating ATPase